MAPFCSVGAHWLHVDKISPDSRATVTAFWTKSMFDQMRNVFYVCVIKNSISPQTLRFLSTDCMR